MYAHIYTYRTKEYRHIRHNLYITNDFVESKFSLHRSVLRSKAPYLYIFLEKAFFTRNRIPTNIHIYKMHLYDSVEFYLCWKGLRFKAPGFIKVFGKNNYVCSGYAISLSVCSLGNFKFQTFRKSWLVQKYILSTPRNVFFVQHHHISGNVFWYYLHALATLMY